MSLQATTRMGRPMSYAYRNWLGLHCHFPKSDPYREELRRFFCLLENFQLSRLSPNLKALSVCVWSGVHNPLGIILTWGSFPVHVLKIATLPGGDEMCHLPQALMDFHYSRNFSITQVKFLYQEISSHHDISTNPKKWQTNQTVRLLLHNRLSGSPPPSTPIYTFYFPFASGYYMGMNYSAVERCQYGFSAIGNPT